MFLDNYPFTQMEQNATADTLIAIAKHRIPAHIQDLEDLGLKDEVAKLHAAAEQHPDRAAFAHEVYSIDGLIAFEIFLYFQAQQKGLHTPWPPAVPGLDDVKDRAPPAV